MHFTLKQIEIFRAAARQLSFVRAAEQLHISPPAVSKQIKNLERQCGIKLFEQLGRKIRLTHAGQQLLQQSDKLDQEACALDTMIQHDFRQMKEPIKLSFGSLLGGELFKLVHTFKKQHKDTQFTLSVAAFEEQIARLKSGDVDIYLSGTRTEDRLLTCRAFGTIPFKLYMCSAHKQAAPIPEKLADEVVITVPRHEIVNPAYRRIVAQLGGQQKCYLESFAAVKEAIIAQLGIGFLPTSLVKKEDPLVALAIEGLSFKMPVYTIMRRQKTPRSDITRFLDDLSQSAFFKDR